ncbi:MAG: hypothetical protein IKI82_02455 [Lachnospiraceae bacterium]|nr:hypothetical protein [Lachnospiraceae bacterium]
MKKIRWKALILSLIFVLTCAAGMLGGAEAGQTEKTGGLVSAASLPVMCFSCGDVLIDPLYGYTSGESVGADHQTVFPFPDGSLEMTAYLLDGRERIRSLSYELRSEDGSRLVARGEVTSFNGETGRQSFTLRFEDILDPDVYYHLRFAVSVGQETANYYVRVIKLSDPAPFEALLSYGQAMHADLFARDTARKYAPQLETDTQTDKETLAEVTIHGNFDQLSWGSSGAEQISETWLTIEGIQANYAYLSFAYLVKAPFSETQDVRLRVTEDLTLQYSETTIYVLNYDRHTEQLWDFSGAIATSQGFLLGMQGDGLQRLSSKNEKYTAFTVAGELYCYDADQQKLSQVFSFRSVGEHELRTLQRDYELKILEVDDKGRVEFVVSGYMNGGSREGNCGMSYCSYDAAENSVQEHISISSRQSAEALNRELDRLMAKGNDHFLYFAFDGEVLVMDISTGETAVLVSSAEYPGLVINDAGTVFAWGSGSDPDLPSALRVVDLNTGRNETVSARAEEFIRPLGYIREDLILGYGLRGKNALSDGLNTLYPYVSFTILDADLNPLHGYAFENVFIDHIEISTEKVTIHRFGLDPGTGEYIYLDPDVMLRNDGEPAEALDFTDYYHDDLKKLAILSYAHLPNSLRIERNVVKTFIPGRSVTLPSAEEKTYGKQYFAYGRGKLKGVCRQVGEAIVLAGPDYGFVLDETGRLVWCWSSRGEVIGLTPSPYPLKDAEKGGQISGASFRQLLYYLNEGIPVYWVCPDQEPRWLIGYNWNDVTLFNPQDGSSYELPIDDLNALIRRENNYLWYYKD